MIWQDTRFQAERNELDTQLRVSMGKIMPTLGQGNWLGITVMPALASPIPLPGTGEFLADMRFLSRLVKRHRISALQIEPVRSRDLWRSYQLDFRADASKWVSVLSHLSQLPGLQLQQQEWTDEGLATLQVRIIGKLPETVVGQVGGGGGETRLLLKEGRLQRSGKANRSFQSNVH